jgi:hypothetical protein
MLGFFERVSNFFEGILIFNRKVEEGLEGLVLSRRMERLERRWPVLILDLFNYKIVDGMCKSCTFGARIES